MKGGSKTFIMCFILAATVAGNHPVVSAEDHHHCYPGRTVLSRHSLTCAANKFENKYKDTFIKKANCTTDYYFKIRIQHIQTWKISYCNLDNRYTVRLNPNIFAGAALVIDARCTTPGSLNKGGYYVNPGATASVHFTPLKLTFKEVIKQAGKKTLKYGKHILKPIGACIK